MFLHLSTNNVLVLETNTANCSWRVISKSLQQKEKITPLNFKFKNQVRANSLSWATLACFTEKPTFIIWWEKKQFVDFTRIILNEIRADVWQTNSGICPMRINASCHFSYWIVESRKILLHCNSASTPFRLYITISHPVFQVFNR